jgi:uncharacterized protein (DUF433 family)
MGDIAPKEFAKSINQNMVTIGVTSSSKIMARSKRIVVDPKIMVGKPVIKGTRIPVVTIIHRIAEGSTMEEIIQDYPKITKKDIKAVLEYAESVMRGEDILPRIEG